jgi:rhodanese-related sulfurtransferase
MSSLMLLAALAVGPAPTATAQNDGFKLIHVADLSTMESDTANPVHVYDANGEETRQKEGIIPGAVLLSSFDGYDVAKTLPQNKSASLVFYCGNTRCMASHAAAERASHAGYANVSVMADGIAGWKKAGKPVSKL